MPAARARLQWDYTFTPDQYERISRGFIPNSMDDHRLICLDDNWLEFYRLDRLLYFPREIGAVEDGYHVDKIWVNRDPEQYGRKDDRKDLENLSSFNRPCAAGRR